MTFIPEKSKVYFIPLGGVREIGRNCYLYGMNRKWLMVDCGINFPSRYEPGAEYVLPDTRFIEHHKNNLAGIILTHGHEDHIGALPFVWPKLQCDIYATIFTYELIERKFKEHGLSTKKLHKLDPVKGFKIGPFKGKLLPVAHSIPEAYSLAFETSEGTLLHTGDWKIDPDPLVGHVTNVEAFEKIGKRGITALIGDSTNAQNQGYSGSEKDVREKFIQLFKGMPNAVVVTCFSSNVARVDSIIYAAEEAERHVCLVGRSLQRNVEIAMETGFLKDMPAFVDMEDAEQLPRDRMLYIATGCQGEIRAAMARIADGSHKYIRLEEGDDVIFSSNQIPGNEIDIMNIQNLLVGQGVNITTHHDDLVHVSGHPNREELKQMYEWVNPTISIPVHGELAHMHAHGKLAQECGVENIVKTYNGSIVEITRDHAQIVGHLEMEERGMEEGKQNIALDGTRMQQRRKMSYNGAAMATVLQRSDHSFVMPITVSILGIYDTDQQRQDLEQQAADDIKIALANIHHNSLQDDSFVEETARIALRRSLKSSTGKKPVLEVRLVKVA